MTRIKRQATSKKKRRTRRQAADIRLSPQALMIHEAWAIENGYQASSSCDKLSQDNLPIYNGSNYKPMDPLAVEAREEVKRINKFRASSRKIQGSRL